MLQTQSAKPSRGSHRRRDNRLQNSALAKFCSLSMLLRAPFKRNDSNGMLNCIHTAASSSTQYPSRYSVHRACFIIPGQQSLFGEFRCSFDGLASKPIATSVHPNSHSRSTLEKSKPVSRATNYWSQQPDSELPRSLIEDEVVNMADVTVSSDEMVAGHFMGAAKMTVPSIVSAAARPIWCDPAQGTDSLPKRTDHPNNSGKP